MYFKSWRSLGGLSREIWILCISTLVNRMGTMALPFLALYLVQNQHYSKAEAGFFVTIYWVGAIFSASLAGHLSDSWGPKRVIQLSLFLSGILLLLFPWATGRTALALLTFLWGTVNEAYRPPSMVLIAETANPAQQKPAYSLYRLAINLGMSVGPVLGGWLAIVSFPSIFYIDGLTAIAAGILISRLPSDSKKHSTESSSTPRRSILLSDPTFSYFLLTLLPVMIIFIQHEAAMPLYLVRDLHFRESAFGLLFPINTLIIIFLEVPLNTAMANWSHARSIALGSFLTGLGFGALAWAHTFFEAAITVVIWTFGEMILFPALAAYVADIAPTRYRGRYMGLYAMASSLACAIGPGLGSFVLDKFGGRVLWGGLFALGVLSALMTIKFRRKTTSSTKPAKFTR